MRQNKVKKELWRWKEKKTHLMMSLSSEPTLFDAIPSFFLPSAIPSSLFPTLCLPPGVDPSIYLYHPAPVSPSNGAWII